MQPGQQKITQFDEVTSTQSGDVIPIVRGGQNKKISVENFTGVLPEGWLTPAEAWTFASFGNGVGVITIPEGNINRYPNGTRVWFKQGTPTATNRYGVVIASTTTTLTVAMIAGTVLSNLTIQQPAISSEVAPRTSENVDFTASIVYSNYVVGDIYTGTASISIYANTSATLAVVVPSSGKVQVSFKAQCVSSASGAGVSVAVGATGANSIAFDDENADARIIGNSPSVLSGTIIFTELNPGLTTFRIGLRSFAIAGATTLSKGKIQAVIL